MTHSLSSASIDIFHCFFTSTIAFHRMPWRNPLPFHLKQLWILWTAPNKLEQRSHCLKMERFWSIFCLESILFKSLFSCKQTLMLAEFSKHACRDDLLCCSLSQLHLFDHGSSITPSAFCFLMVNTSRCFLFFQLFLLFPSHHLHSVEQLGYFPTPLSSNEGSVQFNVEGTRKLPSRSTSNV